jgi:hypothetical protein
MRRFLLATVFLGIFVTQALPSASIYCGDDQGRFVCVAAVRFSQGAEAVNQAADLCSRSGLHNCHPFVAAMAAPLLLCRSIYAPPGNWPSIYSDGITAQQAALVAKEACSTRLKNAPPCVPVLTVCEASDNPADIQYSPALIGTDQKQVAFTSPTLPQVPPQQSTQPPRLPVSQQIIYSSDNSFTAAAVGFAIAILFAIGLIFRHPISNFVIHGNLPRKLDVYGDDIRCVFKRTQRVNWYGRVIFGIVANLPMMRDQLTDVRKYWLGRVVAFDSLRRQRQNELAKMHFQLAASAKSDAHDKKNFWSRRWATVRTFLRRLFWIFAALFRLLFSFLFIRVTVAKLVRGTVIESKDLTLILQAKEAIELTATYLKEYLQTANTFDGRGEVV